MRRPAATEAHRGERRKRAVRPETGTIPGLRLTTVKKRRESTCVKLGVEHRTAGVTLAPEKITPP